MLRWVSHYVLGRWKKKLRSWLIDKAPTASIVVGAIPQAHLQATTLDHFADSLEIVNYHPSLITTFDSEP